MAGIISSLVSPDKLRALGELKAFIIEPILLFYAILLLADQKKIKINLVLQWLFYGAGLVSIFGIIQYFTFLKLPLNFWGTGQEIERITSVFPHPNALALYLGPLFAFFFTLFIYDYQLFKRRWLEISGLVVMFIAVVLTFSRGAWFGVFLGLLLLLARKFGIKKIALPVILLGLLLLAVPAVRSRIGLGLSDPSTSVHWQLMRLGIEKISQNPLLGNGLHGFQAFTVEYPHNVFLNFWLEMGLLGLISFCWIIALIFEQQIKKPSVLRLAVGIYLLVMILHGLVDMAYLKNDLSVLFWFMAAIAYL